MCGFDLESLTISKKYDLKNTTLPRHKPNEKFLKGPIPLRWLTKAAQQPGKALHVSIAIWFLAGLRKCRIISLSGSVLRSFGIKRHSGYGVLRL